MGTEEALTFSAAAPFIAALIGVAKSWWDAKPRVWTPVAIGAALAWGGLLWVSDRWEGDAALFVVTGTTVGFAASGMHGALRAIAPKVARFGPNQDAGSR